MSLSVFQSEMQENLISFEQMEGLWLYFADMTIRMISWDG